MYSCQEDIKQDDICRVTLPHMTETNRYPVRRWDQLCINEQVTDPDHEKEIIIDILNASRRRLDKLQALAASPASGIGSIKKRGCLYSLSFSAEYCQNIWRRLFTKLRCF